jgi:hypothetical protein
MAKEVFTLTNEDKSYVLGGNVESGKGVSLRSAFGIGKGAINTQMGTDITFRPVSNAPENFFTSMLIHGNYQNQMNPDGFNYPLFEGEEIVITARNLQPGQSIHMEVEYEIMDLS